MLPNCKWAAIISDGPMPPKLQKRSVESMKFKGFVMMLILLSLSGEARAVGPTKIVMVALDCGGEDTPGERFCSGLKEKIRASHGFRLVSKKEATDAPTGFCVHAISEDVNDNGANLLSAVAVVFTFPLRNGSEIYITSYIQRFGIAHVDDAVESIFAALDKESEFLQK